jgi:hypothetical protein
MNQHRLRTEELAAKAPWHEEPRRHGAEQNAPGQPTPHGPRSPASRQDRDDVRRHGAGQHEKQRRQEQSPPKIWVQDQIRQEQARQEESREHRQTETRPRPRDDANVVTSPSGGDERDHEGRTQDDERQGRARPTEQE